jgi:phosphopantothenoylcysteine decarboxylase / phosphopantothenate---cysteine ligase
MRVPKNFNNLRDKKVLITAGPTREYWDPVRYISNASSGHMGIALAQEARQLGARVTLIIGPVTVPVPRSQKDLQVLRVMSAQEMEAAVGENLPGTQVFVGAAAVADFRPEVILKKKIKDESSEITLRLVRNPDIIAHVARRSPNRPPVVIGFALETHDLVLNAQQKLKSKGLDWIVANPDSNIGQRGGTAKLLSRWGEQISLGKMPKNDLAKRIWEALLERPAL